MRSGLCGAGRRLLRGVLRLSSGAQHRPQRPDPECGGPAGFRDPQRQQIPGQRDGGDEEKIHYQFHQCALRQAHRQPPRGADERGEQLPDAGRLPDVPDALFLQQPQLQKSVPGFGGGEQRLHQRRHAPGRGQHPGHAGRGEHRRRRGNEGYRDLLHDQRISLPGGSHVFFCFVYSWPISLRQAAQMLRPL